MDLPKTFTPGFHNEECVKKMKYNEFGETGLKVSQLSLGTAGFSTIYGDYSIASCKETVLKALKSGVNYIDSGYWYGQNLAQQILGKCLKDIPRGAYYLATKIGRYEKELENMFDFSSEKTKWCIENNLKTLGVDYIDIIQIHDIEFAPSLDYLIENTLPVLIDARNKGIIKYIGITGYPVSVLEEFIRRSPIKIDMILSYTRLTLIDDTLKKHIPYFKQQGIGIVNASGLSMGLLSDDGPQVWHPANDEIKSACKRARDYCKKKEVKLSKIAMHSIYVEPDIHTHLIGMNNAELVEDNLDSLFNGLNEKEQEALSYIKENIFSKIKDRHWEGVELTQYLERKNN